MVLPNMPSKVAARRMADALRDQAERRSEAASSSRKINHSTVTRPGGVRAVGAGSIEAEAADGSGVRLAGGVLEQRPSPDEPWQPFAPPLPDLTELYEELDALTVELAAVLPITETKIADDAITTPKIVANAVTTLKLAAEAVTAEKLFVDTAMVVKLVAKMIEVEALNAQVVTGLRIIGGSISIAQGVESVLEQDFATASGTTPPSGWTRLAIDSTAPNAGIFFDTSGGSPGRKMRLQLKPATASQRTRHVAFPSSLTAQDVYIAFDYMWDGTPFSSVFPSPTVNVVARSDETTVASRELNNVAGVGLRLRGGGMYVYSRGSSTQNLFAIPGFASDAIGLSEGAAANTWYRVEMEVRGSSVRARAYPKGSTPTPWTSGTIANAYPTAGKVLFGVDTFGLFDGASDADHAINITRIRIETLRTGFDVAPDGTATVPDPTLPLGIVNWRTLLAKVDGPPWKNPVDFRTGIEAVPGNEVQYRYHNGYLEFKGRARRPSGTWAVDSTSTLFTIDPPPKEIAFGCMGGAGVRPGRVFVRENGDVDWNNGNAGTSALVYFDNSRIAL